MHGQGHVHVYVCGQGHVHVYVLMCVDVAVCACSRASLLTLLLLTLLHRHGAVGARRGASPGQLCQHAFVLLACMLLHCLLLFCRRSPSNGSGLLSYIISIPVCPKATMAMQCAGGGGEPPDWPFENRCLEVVDVDEENSTDEENMRCARSQCMHVCFAGLH